MAEVKWIKITTDIFDDEKIKIIDTMPARDEILVIWFKLLSLAGRSNQGGMLIMNNRIPYTNEMLSAVFNRELNTVKLSLQIFETYGMVEVEENKAILISNWDKHQNIEGLDKIREQNKIRVAKYRENKRLLLEGNVTGNATVTEGNAIELDKELELELDIDKDKKPTIPKLSKTEIVINAYTSNKDLHIAITDFITMRKKLRKPMTDRALELFLMKLTKLSTNDDERIEIINNSTMNCYQGIFPLKKEGANNGFTGKNTTESKGKWAGYKVPKHESAPLTAEQRADEPI